MLRKNAKIDLLRRVPLFSACSKSQLADIAMVSDEIDVPPGKVLIREGERGRQFFIVIEGNVSVSMKGRNVPIKGGTEFFGEIALLSNAPTTATVTTTSPVHALVVAGHRFKKLIETSPGIQLKILHSLAERLAPETF
jgi:CRP/FNR family transcriptional regulator, cyclic AMP receptor protein